MVSGEGWVVIVANASLRLFVIARLRRSRGNPVFLVIKEVGENGIEILDSRA